MTQTSLNTVTLEQIIRDLTKDRLIIVKPDDDIIDPSINSRDHIISIANITKGINVRIKKRVKIISGDLVFSKLHTQNGAFAFADREYHATNTFIPFSIDHKQIISDYLFWALHLVVPKLTTSDTVGRETYKVDDILKMEIPLPTIESQKKIIEKINYYFALIKKIKEMQLKNDFNRIYDEMFFEIFANGKSENWKSGKLNDGIIESRYGTSEKTNDDNSGTPIIRMGNIQDGNLVLDNLKYLSLSEKEKEKLLLRKGDVLVNRTNSAELVGKSAVFDQNDEFGFASYIIRLRFDPNIINPQFASIYINSQLGREYILNKKKQMTGQANVNSEKLKGLPIIFPDTNLQAKIVQQLTNLKLKIKELNALQRDIDDKLQYLEDSFLNKLFYN